MLKPSGIDWCNQYPTSRSLSDLIEPFRSNVQSFLNALMRAGICVTINATFRPPERAYLMHTAAMIAGYRDQKTGHWVEVSPATVQDDFAAALGIDWTHGGDLKTGRQAAAEMCKVFSIVYPPALQSRHCEGRAIDVSLSWDSPKHWVMKSDGAAIGITGPGSGPHPLLVAVGVSYGVRKLEADPPHWSDDGH